VVFDEKLERIQLTALCPLDQVQFGPSGLSTTGHRRSPNRSVGGTSAEVELQPHGPQVVGRPPGGRATVPRRFSI
jgi:hypothetical protein